MRRALLALAAGLLVAGPGAAAAVAADPSLTVEPRPGPGVTGVPTVTWDTGDGADGLVTVVAPESTEERTFGKAPQGTGQAPWLKAGFAYTFRLYATDDGDRKLLETVEIAGAPPAAAAAPAAATPPAAAAPAAVAATTGAADDDGGGGGALQALLILAAVAAVFLALAFVLKARTAKNP